MKKKGHTPITRVKNHEPNIESPNWVFCDTCSDRLLFKEIKKSLNTEKINY